jgi:hypothetical protein
MSANNASLLGDPQHLLAPGVFAWRGLLDYPTHFASVEPQFAKFSINRPEDLDRARKIMCGVCPVIQRHLARYPENRLAQYLTFGTHPTQDEFQLLPVG